MLVPQAGFEPAYARWLTDHSVPFRDEVRFKNVEQNKTYFADFVFDDIKLIIELDGSQHLKTIEADSFRDQYITRVYGYKVLRASHREYIAKSKQDHICDLLGIDRMTR